VIAGVAPAAATPRRTGLLIPMLDVLFFEIESVVIDTRSARRDALLGAIESVLQLRVDPPEPALDDVLDGRPARDAARCLLARSRMARDDVELDLIAVDASRRLACTLEHGVMLQPGATRFIASVHGRVRLAVVTQLRRPDADAVLRLAGIEAAFESIVTADDVIEEKPSPEGYCTGLERMARRRPVATWRCAALDGSRSGIRAARGAAIRTVAVGALAPEHAMEAEAFVPSLDGLTLEMLHALVGDRRGSTT